MTPKGDLIRRLTAEASRPTDTLRGGFGARIRADQKLMREAAEILGRWGRPPRAACSKPTQHAMDLFSPEKEAA
jgi:hypothetical protein